MLAADCPSMLHSRLPAHAAQPLKECWHPIVSLDVMCGSGHMHSQHSAGLLQTHHCHRHHIAARYPLTRHGGQKLSIFMATAGSRQVHSLAQRRATQGPAGAQNLAEELPPAVRLWAVDTALVVPSCTVKPYAKAYAYRSVRIWQLCRTLEASGQDWPSC